MDRSSALASLRLRVGGDTHAWAIYLITVVIALCAPFAMAADGLPGDGLDGGLGGELSGGLTAGLNQQVRQLALAGTRTAGSGPSRVDVVVGQLDARLRLAPCQRVEPYLPQGTRLWGKTRIGLRCAQGTSAWNVFLPITVKIYGQALVATAAVPTGSVLNASDLVQAEVDLAEDTSIAVADANAAVGRTLARPLMPGQSLRLAHLKPRQWFAAGETVRVSSSGPGFSMASEGQALTHGIEGQLARVRTEGGRVLTGQPVAEHRMELAL